MCIEWIWNRRGHIVVEAALLVPLFLLALISISLLIRLQGIEEQALYAFTKQAHQISIQAYGFESSDRGTEEIAQGIGWELGTVRQLEAEQLPIQAMRLSSFRYRFTQDGTDHLIEGTLCFGTTLALPITFRRWLEFEERLLLRGFVGSKDIQEPQGFDEMERESNDESVYVFPRAGKKYHRKSCRIIAVHPTEVILSRALEKKWAPCRLCHPEQLAYGSTVCRFEATGSVFHRMTCTVVERYVISVSIKQAQDAGYAPCLICIGEESTGGDH